MRGYAGENSAFCRWTGGRTQGLAAEPEQVRIARADPVTTWTKEMSRDLQCCGKVMRF